MAQALLNREHVDLEIGPVLVTTAGDIERESKSRRYNAIEALGIQIFLLTMLWPVSYIFGYVHDIDIAKQAAAIALFCGAMFLLFVSPFMHRDTLESWGLGGPRHTLAVLRRATPARRRIFIGVMAALMVFLNILNLWQWPEVADFLQIDKLTLGGVRAPDWAGHFPHIIPVVLIGLILSSFIVFCGIRYDNFGSAFKTAMKISLPLLAMILLGGVALSVNAGTNPFKDFDPIKYGLNVFAYVFWGFTQQLLFCSYFGTRLRKAFPPSNDPSNIIPPEKRLPFAAAVGLAVGIVLAAVFFAMIRSLYPADQAPISTFFWMIPFIAPFAALWGYFYGLDKRRLLVATLTGTFFGLIHIDSYGLVATTFLLGVFLAYVFMEEKNRNLVALGFIHGLLGSTLGWLFDSDESGAVKIDYSVGPAGVDNETYAAVIFPVLCIIAYTWLAVWAYRNLSPAKPQPLHAGQREVALENL